MPNPRSGAALRGVVPVVPTPFTADEAIDHGSLATLVSFAADSGLSAVCLPAYASEFYKLSDAERRSVVVAAIEAAEGRIAVMAQANHPSARLAADLARDYESLGASLISFALPRQFPLKEADLVEYARTICQATRLPVMVQDFSPGGATVGADFARRLNEHCGNFRYLKLEEPMLDAKVRAIGEATAGRVEVLEGWGGMYLLELIESGICGLIPGLGVADLLQRVWHLATAGKMDEATGVFQVLLPQIVFSLQHTELFNWVEKRLLVARGILRAESSHVRRATWTPDEATLKHTDRVNAQVVALARRLGMTS